jgi:hypothetical protein
VEQGYRQNNDVRREVKSAARPRHRQTTGHAVLDLIDQARSCLAESASASTANERFAAAHLAAIRAAAAVLAARARPADPRRVRRRTHGPRNVWDLLPTVACELSEWATFFAAHAGKRAAAQAGLPMAVTRREADDLLRQADAFVSLVCVCLGMPYLEPLDGPVAVLASGG